MDEDTNHYIQWTDKDYINDILNHLYKSSNDFLTVNDIYPEKKYTTEKINDFELLVEGTGLTESVQKDKYKAFKLTTKGWNNIRKHGSYLNWIATEKWKPLIEEDNKKELELKKLMLDLSDYPETKARARRSECYAILAIILSMIAIALQWIHSKNG